MALFNKTKEAYLLSEIKTLDIKLKYKINDVRKRLVRSKIRSNNPKSFWNKINNLQGNSEGRRFSGLSIKIDGVLTTDEYSISHAFAKFFSDKVCKLSMDTGPYLWARTGDIVTVSKDELEAAIKSLKNKMCCGHDEIPMKILKDAAPSMHVPLLNLMNLACQNIPDSWKRSVITPSSQS
jgi:hypothetical protein